MRAILIWAGALAPARADTREFDRPGIAFAPSTLPSGAVAWEQGSPDVERNASDGTTQTSYSANTRLRVGVTGSFELQLAVPSYVWVDTEGEGGDSSHSRIGDVGIVFKPALPSKVDRFAWAAEAIVSFPSGKDEIGNGTEQYSLGATAAWAVTERQSAAFYANVDDLRATRRGRCRPTGASRCSVPSADTSRRATLSGIRAANRTTWWPAVA